MLRADRRVRSIAMTSACRFCGAPLRTTFVDLGVQPLANSYLTADQVAAGCEARYPLHRARMHTVLVGSGRRRCAGGGDLRRKLRLLLFLLADVGRARSAVLAREVLLNAGSSLPSLWWSRWPATTATCCSTLWRWEFPCLGVEPTANTAEAARARGVRTEVRVLHPGLGRSARPAVRPR